MPTDTTPSDETADRRNQLLIDELCAHGRIRSAQIERAFRATPRHRFLPGVPLDQVYRDGPVVTKWDTDMPISSSSQPTSMAIMLEALDLRPGQRILEIGAGVGYNAALMAHLVGATGHVTTIDVDDDIVDAARNHLRAAGMERIEVICGDGGLGHAVGAPYDRIIVTAGANDIAAAWWDQLAAGGRIVVPITGLDPRKSFQLLLSLDAIGDHLAGRVVSTMLFVPMRGAIRADAETEPAVLARIAALPAANRPAAQEQAIPDIEVRAYRAGQATDPAADDYRIVRRSTAFLCRWR
jgi:protein-L-isoaspartate(D-aspartate) O-methyltransferase